MTRVIHLPTSTGGNPQGISRHLCKLGLDSRSWVMNRNFFDYSVDFVISDSKDSLATREIKRIAALRYVFKCDVVFYNYGTSLYQPYPTIKGESVGVLQKLKRSLYSTYLKCMPFFERTLIRLLRRRVFIMYQGDDARQGDYCRENFSITFANRVGSEYYSPKSDIAKRKRIAFFDSYAERIYALNPDLLHVLPKRAEFLPYSHISLDEWFPAYCQSEDRPLRVGHAPSHRGVKGTDLILEAVSDLKSRGFQFEFTLIEGVSNAEAKKIIERQDIVIDQLFAGWYGGLAVESMALGKPVIVYIRENDLRFIPVEMREEMPVIRTTPEEIVMTLQRILETPRSVILDIAKASRKFVERWHNPEVIANRLKNDLDLPLNIRSSRY